MFTLQELITATGGGLSTRVDRVARVGGISTDTRTLRRGEAFLAIAGERFDGHEFIVAAAEAGCRCVIGEKKRLSGILSRLPQGVAVIGVEDGVKALGGIARFHRRRFDIPVIAVTGSSGKTTCKEMISWVLQGQHKVLRTEGTKNNHIGLPQTLLQLNAGHGMAVVELGTNHFGEIAYLTGICEPNVGVITNIGPAHLEYFGTLEGVRREKFSLIRGLRAPKIGVLNADDPLLKGVLLKDRARARCLIGFGIRTPADYYASDAGYGRGALSFTVNGRQPVTLRTAGFHNVSNALAACAVARCFGMDHALIAKRLAGFVFPRGRFSLIRVEGVRFIDDTYNANPLSLSLALQALSGISVRGRKILVLGEMRELGSRAEEFHAQAGAKAAGICDALVVVGELARAAAASACACGFDPRRVFTCASAEEARGVLYAKIAPGAKDIVLVKGSRAMRMERIFSKGQTHAV